jgi:hypothetical protein
MKSLFTLFIYIYIAQTFAFVCDTSIEDRNLIYSKALANLKKINNFVPISTPLTFNSNISLGNPGGKYGVFNFPEYLQPPILKVLGKQSLYNKFFNSSKYSVTPNQKDALIFLTCTPTNVEYYSFVNYIMTRVNNKTAWVPAVPLNDPINHLVINTTKQAFNATTLIISTGDYYVFEQIKYAFINAGLNESAINLLPITNVKFRHHLKPWVLDESDMISWHFRIISENPDKKFLDTIWPAYYLLNINLEPTIEINAVKEKNRITGKTQEYLLPTFNKLIDLVKNKYKLNMVSSISHVVPDFHDCLTDNGYPVFPPIVEWNFSGIHGCCDFFVRDSLYSILPNINTTHEELLNLKFTKQNTEFVAIGVNQVQMNTSVYSNLLITSFKSPENSSHTSNLTSTEITGSAIQFGDEFKNFFVYKWSRKCDVNELFCTEISQERIADDDFILFAERKYLNPKTTIGPDKNELIEPVVLFSQ